MSNADTLVTIYHPDQGNENTPAGRAQCTMAAFIETYEPKGFVIDNEVPQTFVNSSAPTEGIPSPDSELDIEPFDPEAPPAEYVEPPVKPEA